MKGWPQTEGIYECYRWRSDPLAVKSLCKMVPLNRATRSPDQIGIKGKISVKVGDESRNGVPCGEVKLRGIKTGEVKVDVVAR